MPTPQAITFCTLAIVTIGCGSNPGHFGGGPRGGAAEEGPFGPPKRSELLSPFAGAWTLDFEKTLEAKKASGIADEQLEQLRKLHAENPQLADKYRGITINGNEAVGTYGSEYRLFAVHEHNGKICGKAWHHEDRYDPGDMSKCYIRLQLNDGLLYLEVKMKDGLPDLNDPELLSSDLPAEGGSSATCDADAPPGNGWSEWTTDVYAPKQ